MNEHFSNIIITFLAPPGGGKGTISQQAAQELGFSVISTGNLCRIYKDKDNDIGHQMRDCLAQGRLVPDAIISAMVQEWLSENATGTPIILDGYPRSLTQAQDLMSMLTQYAPAYKFLIVELDVAAEAIVKRLSSRMICSEKQCQRPHTILGDGLNETCISCHAPLIRRHDDIPDVIRERIAVYTQGIKIIKDFFIKQAIPIATIVVATKTPQEVFASFKETLLLDNVA